MSENPEQRFVTLDGLRGIAALMVVAFHWSLRLPLHLDRAYLAVDLFFVLSGFVIANAYDNRLSAGMSTVEFMIMRMIRLYPLYLLGVVVGLFVFLISLIHHGQVIATQSDTKNSVLFALLMLPTPSAVGSLYPLDPPAWSLLFELLANLIYALTIRFWTVKRLVIFAIVMATAMVIRSIITGDPGPGSGAQWKNVTDGFLRVGYSFTVGVVLFRGRIFRFVPRIPAILVLIALPVLLVRCPAWAQLPLVVLGFPALVAAAAGTQPRGFLRPLSGALGAASYAIYVIHWPAHDTIGMLLDGLHARFNPVGKDAVLLPFLAVGCWLLARYFDAPARGLLRSLFIARGGWGRSAQPSA